MDKPIKKEEMFEKEILPELDRIREIASASEGKEQEKVNAQAFDILMDDVRSINLLAWSDRGDSDYMKLRAIARATDVLLSGKSLTASTLSKQASPWIATAERAPTVKDAERSQVLTRGHDNFPDTTWYYKVVKCPRAYPFWMSIPALPDSKDL